MSDQAPRTAMNRWMPIGFMLLTATGVSGVAGMLAHAAGNNVPAAILTGGGAFAGAAGLLLAIAHYARDR
ncbi:hypothetical protein [Actinoplanes sp. NPDC051851]|uniref:hypothetical protein n=1 Tax=Actinoplanes sp. NPDC051851 TaxID=3154753 RepID=UPI003445ECBA